MTDLFDEANIKNEAFPEEETREILREIARDARGLVAELRRKIETIKRGVKEDRSLVETFFDEFAIGRWEKELQEMEREMKKWEFRADLEAGVTKEKQNLLLAKDVSILEIAVATGHAPQWTSNDRAKILCPFHKERTPSFVFFKKTNSYYCFGCQEKGDGIDFFMKVNNGIGFQEACTRILAL